jgi:UDP:flavonoid glycosyltransferase YjiC (YdhE family)
MRGHLFPALAILERLRDRGHEVAVRALAAEVPMLRELGLDAEPLDPRLEELAMDDWRARSPFGAARRSVGVFLARAAFDGPGLRPARRLPGRLRDGLGWALVERSFDRFMLGDLNRVRTALGAPALSHAQELFTRPPLLLYMTSEDFDYRRRDLPANVAFVGPCAWDPPARLPAALDAVEEPLVLVTTSSDFQDDGRLVRTALEALANEPCHVVATLPAAEAGRLPPAANATIETFLPHGAVLARASCAITHGGMGATQKALAAGVPVCAVPFGRDQFEVARRVEEAAAGTRLPAWRLDSKRLRRKVAEATARRPGAERLARSFAAFDGAGVAADAFERLLG